MQDKDVIALVARARAPEAPYRADAAGRLSRLVVDGVHRRLPQVRAALLAALRDPDPRVRRRVAWLPTARQGHQLYRALPLDRWSRKDYVLASRVCPIDPDADMFDDGDLRAVLDDPDGWVRIPTKVSSASPSPHQGDQHLYVADPRPEPG